MSPMADDELWTRAAARVGQAMGGRVALLSEISRPSGDHRVWRGEILSGRLRSRQVIVKARADPFAAERAMWASTAWPELAACGYPPPEMIWHGRLDERWYLVVQSRLAGTALTALTAPTLGRLLELVEL